VYTTDQLDHGAVGKHLAGRRHRGTNRGCSGCKLIELHIPVHLLIPVRLPIYYFRPAAQFTPWAKKNAAEGNLRGITCFKSIGVLLTDHFILAKNRLP
jgi:hypothetical protein